ncbi:hypothetical protein LAG90_14935 [Marinilongibacter aquaticus]|uniref:hypothetical protein n=1 Tax=Marinilongibacter aquaticus TaxID=2975157 RepID=UPI0021BDC5C8|nr:hypothetical protein [Marinilongibacter aquaticus]UBM58099.1 hypothetical protein LAG90_14935 [Marinilongibacter aquaticus]
MKKVLFTLILSLALQSCDWIKSLGPEEPFFCKINGQKFRPEKDTRSFGWGGVGPLNVTVDKEFNWLYIDATNTPQLIYISVKLDANNKIELGQHIMYNDIGKTSGSYFVDFTQEAGKRNRMLSKTGIVTISKVDGYKICGTFEFTCKDSTNNKEYRITEGEFNKLSYY